MQKQMLYAQSMHAEPDALPTESYPNHVYQHADSYYKSCQPEPVAPQASSTATSKQRR